jgi:hypothetical protein
MQLTIQVGGANLKPREQSSRMARLGLAAGKERDRGLMRMRVLEDERYY